MGTLVGLVEGMRLVFISICMLASAVNFFWAIVTDDKQQKQVRLLYAIFFMLFGVQSMLSAIGLKTGAFPITD